MSANEVNSKVMKLSDQSGEEPIKKMEASNQTDEMKDLLAIFECPVCLDHIQETPIYICENSSGHSFCFKCYKSLKNEGPISSWKCCPVCRKPVTYRRSLGLEKVLEEVLLKKCRVNGCSQRLLSTRAVIANHEEDFHRTMPCVWCDEKIGLESLADHLKKHNNREPLRYFGPSARSGFSIPKSSSIEMMVLTGPEQDGSPKFLLNMTTLEEADAKAMWLSYIGPKDMASTFKYTIQVKTSKNSTEKYLQEGTLVCEPCDLTHQEMKRELSGFVVSKKRFEEAVEGNEDNGLHVNITVKKSKMAS